MREKGKRTPLDEKPDFDFHTNWYVDVFNTLSSARPLFQGPSNIPMSDYKAYFDMFEPIDNLRFVIKVLQKMDNMYMSRAYKRMKREIKRGKRK